MIRTFLFALSIIGISTLSAACPNCSKSSESGEVRVRGVLQKKPSSVVYINKDESSESASKPNDETVAENS